MTRSEVQVLLGPPTFLRGCSSIGRAPALQAGGQGFDSPQLHHEAVVQRAPPGFREVPSVVYGGGWVSGRGDRAHSLTINPRMTGRGACGVADPLVGGRPRRRPGPRHRARISAAPGGTLSGRVGPPGVSAARPSRGVRAWLRQVPGANNCRGIIRMPFMCGDPLWSADPGHAFCHLPRVNPRGIKSVPASLSGGRPEFHAERFLGWRAVPCNSTVTRGGPATRWFTSR
jgi:hypothetical protein